MRSLTARSRGSYGLRVRHRPASTQGSSVDPLWLFCVCVYVYVYIYIYIIDRCGFQTSNDGSLPQTGTPSEAFDRLWNYIL